MGMNINAAVTALIDYAEENGLITAYDKIYCTNRVIEALSLDSYECEEYEKCDLQAILKAILDYACENGLCEDSVVYRDLFDTRIMGILTPMPSQVINTFKAKYDVSPVEATDYYYNLSRKSDYIREYRIKNDMKWVTKTAYGDIDITINLSKPEKDPKAIAAARNAKQSGYPKCMLCKENEGYSGRVNHPARQNHRIIPITINNENWFLQYSPYVYYNEHCIVFNSQHTPMVINKSAFDKLFDFVKMFPHYFVGSNADLPIVGGSILSHEHFQGGHYTFAMAKAPIEEYVKFEGFEDVEAGIVNWPMTVIRLRGQDTSRITALAEKVLNCWRAYTDEENFIYAETDGTPHNAITPIARCNEGVYEMDLVLRNNITTDEYPDGYYHPHPEYHHIKKENIGLIEVMGLAVLPSRLKGEMEALKKAMLCGADITKDDVLSKHAEWADMIKSKYDVTADNIDKIIQDEIGIVFAAILEQCGVYSRDEKGREGLIKFIRSVK
ncbi:MAG: UDP-glucose--hexose-1-phosphate uridylyltransferase [Clostridia bacterium]|nr:UDP-glucose--hexose-1-phosphate uridylyltransferase [Clostridia bacterium]